MLPEDKRAHDIEKGLFGPIRHGTGQSILGEIDLPGLEFTADDAHGTVV